MRLAATGRVERRPVERNAAAVRADVDDVGVEGHQVRVAEVQQLGGHRGPFCPSGPEIIERGT